MCVCVCVDVCVCVCVDVCVCVCACVHTMLDGAWTIRIRHQIKLTTDMETLGLIISQIVLRMKPFMTPMKRPSELIVTAIYNLRGILKSLGIQLMKTTTHFHRRSLLYYFSSYTVLTLW